MWNDKRLEAYYKAMEEVREWCRKHLNPPDADKYSSSDEGVNIMCANAYYAGMMCRSNLEYYILQAVEMAREVEPCRASNGYVISGKKFTPDEIVSKILGEKDE